MNPNHDNGEYQLKMVENNGLNIKYIASPSEKVQLAAIRDNGLAIQYIKNPSRKAKQAALKQNNNSAKYINVRDLDVYDGELNQSAHESTPDTISHEQNDTNDEGKNTSARRLFLNPIQTKESQKESFVWTSLNSENFRLTSYLLQKFIRDFATEFWFQYRVDEQSIRIGVGKTDMFYSSALIVFKFQGEIFTLHTNPQNSTNMLSSAVDDISGIGKEIDQIIKETNHLRGNLILIDDNIINFRGIPNITFENAVFSSEIKQDIIDNTIFHIEQMDQSNGIIFYGPPGTGKSLLCSAIINDAHKRKISTVYAATLPEFNGLEELIEKYLGDTIVFLEDIDTYAFSRENGRNFIINNFLQFMNGISQRTNRVIVVATTNYIDALDKAIGQRPVRFNRKFEIGYPQKKEIDDLVKLYIGNNVDSSLCYGKNFTGAHIAEIRRTIDLSTKKKGTSIREEYAEAVNVVSKTFSLGLKTAVGFEVPNKTTKLLPEE
jgi:predicted AAA+ superfamily ATPase